MSRFDHVAPGSLDDALAAGSAADAMYLAGGTDLVREIHAGSADPAHLVSLRAVPGLDQITKSREGGLVIGARVTLSEIGAHRDIRAKWTALSDACLGAASPALRNVATIAGNLLQRPACEYYRTDFRCALKGGNDCPARAGDNTHHAIFGGGTCVSAHPSDAAAALLALGARVHVAGRDGTAARALAELHRRPTAARPTEIALAPGELITAIELPKPSGRSVYLQARERATWAFALVGVAARLTVREGRITRAGLALCGTAPVPWPLPAVEEWLVGRAIKGAAWAVEAGRRAADGARPLPHNRYKVALVEGLVTRALLSLAGKA